MNATIMRLSSLLKNSTKLFTAGVDSMATRKMVIVMFKQLPYVFRTFPLLSHHIALWYGTSKFWASFYIRKSLNSWWQRAEFALKVYKPYYYIHAFQTLLIEFETKYRVVDYAMIGEQVQVHLSKSLCETFLFTYYAWGSICYQQKKFCSVVGFHVLQK